MAVRDIVGLAKKGQKTPPAKKRKDRPLGSSPVNPDLGAAMSGRGGERPGGGQCVGCNNPQGENKSEGNGRVKELTDAVRMDMGLPLPVRKKSGKP